MNEDLKNILSEGICKIDCSLNSIQLVSYLEKLYDQITLFNPVYKLVAADGKELVIRHFLDCLAPYPIFKDYIKNGNSIADLGSGSGLPGLVLASAFDNRFDLVERMGRRAGFLRTSSVLMQLTERVSVVEKDLSDVPGLYDIVTFRAFRQMKDIASDLQRIVKSGGSVMIYKSSEENISEDLQYVDRNIFSYDIKSYEVPFLNASRSLLILHKN